MWRRVLLKQLGWLCYLEDVFLQFLKKSLEYHVFDHTAGGYLYTRLQTVNMNLAVTGRESNYGENEQPWSTCKALETLQASVEALSYPGHATPCRAES